MITEVVSFFYPATPIPSPQGAPDKEAESEKINIPRRCINAAPSGPASGSEEQPQG